MYFHMNEHKRSQLEHILMLKYLTKSKTEDTEEDSNDGDIRELLKVLKETVITELKKAIPKELKKLNIQNLYRVELSNYWRMLYTIEGNTIEIFLFVLKIINHKEYNKLFGYKK